MNKNFFGAIGLAMCLAASLATFGACGGGGDSKVDVPAGMQEYVLEAEYTPVEGKTGAAQSGSASGYDLIAKSSNQTVSNGYYIHNIHMTDCTLEFDFTADRAGTASIYLRLMSQWGNTAFSNANFGVVLNGQDITYSVLVKGSSDDNPDFSDYIVTQNAVIKSGSNKLELVVRQNTINTYTHSTGAPGVDCVKLVSDAGISWNPLVDNLDHVGKVEV